jgi:LmbE family N-acetylglucosaminyl deacetylase
MHPYLKYLQYLEDGIKMGAALPLGGMEPCAEQKPSADAPKVLLFSPHPDDECITGLLPLRLMREAGMKIINVPITFGSNAERQPGRAGELRNACAFLGWEIHGRPGFQTLEKSDVVGILKAEQPAVLFMPHSKDWNSRHISTHFLVMDALAEMPPDFSCTVIETEFWGAMDDPNLMVEGNAQLVADLVAATSFHVEEVKRNPYHLLLPAWMQDNVRRGGELIGGQGGAAPDFIFATLYRLRRWENGGVVDVLKSGRMAAMNDKLKEII